MTRIGAWNFPCVRFRWWSVATVVSGFTRCVIPRRIIAGWYQLRKVGRMWESNPLIPLFFYRFAAAPGTLVQWASSRAMLILFSIESRRTWMNEVWFLMSLFPGTSVSLPWQPTVPSFLLPLEYKSRSFLLPPIMCSSALVFQVSLTYCVRSHHQRRVRRLSCRWRRLNQLTKGKWFCAKGEPPMTGSNLDACVTKNSFCLTQC